MLVYRTEDVVYRNLEWNAEAPGFVIVRRTQADAAISQYPTSSQESRRRNRNCLPEIATGAKRPRNDKSEAISILTIVCVSSGYASGPGV